MSDTDQKPLTWREFKAFVDRLLREQGASEDTPISFIDVSAPDAKHNEPVLQLADGEMGIT